MWKRILANGPTVGAVVYARLRSECLRNSRRISSRDNSFGVNDMKFHGEGSSENLPAHGVNPPLFVVLYSYERHLPPLVAMLGRDPCIHGMRRIIRTDDVSVPAFECHQVVQCRSERPGADELALKGGEYHGAAVGPERQ